MKTKQRIMLAMEALLDTCSYEQITITMITEKVPIARQGFYKFFRNKEDLCRQMFLFFADRATFDNGLSGTFTFRDFVIHDLSEINLHIVFFRKLARQIYHDDLFSILHDNIYHLYMRMLRYKLQREVSDDMSFILDGYCIGGLRLLIELLKKGNPLDVHHLTDLYIEMIPQTIKVILTDGEYPLEILNE